MRQPTSTRSWIAAASLLCAAPALAQKPRWDLPERAAAIYRRVFVPAAELGEVRDDTQVKRHRDPMGLAFPHALEPAMLLAGELDSKRLHFQHDTVDLRDLAAVLAFDLRPAKRGRRTIDLRSVRRCQPLTVEATYSAIDKDGRQQIDGILRTAAGETPQRGRFTASGKITVQRWFDPGRGRVKSLDARGDLTIRGDETSPFTSLRIDLRDTWTWQRDVVRADAEFRARVNQALAAGTAHLKKELQNFRQPQYRARKPGDNIHYAGSGRLALILFTLFKMGERPSDPILEPALEDLRQRNLINTYSLGVSLMALEAMYAPTDERELLRSGRIKAPIQRQPSPADRETIERWVAQLLKNIDATTDAAYIRRWHYGPSQSYDNSNTQYANLGLYAAHLCGVRVSSRVWFAAANHWLEDFQPQKTRIRSTLTSHRDVQREEKSRRSTSGRAAKIVPGGWGYQGKQTITGSMTAAGITGLTICASALRSMRKGNPKLLKRVDQAVRGGFAWFGRNYSVRGNPGAWDAWRLYYLYGVERSCELADVVRFDNRDWYFEGAMHLTETQDKGGNWGGIDDTCFAVLFLKKSAMPVITGR